MTRIKWLHTAGVLIGLSFLTPNAVLAQSAKSPPPKHNFTIAHFGQDFSAPTPELVGNFLSDSFVKKVNPKSYEIVLMTGATPLQTQKGTKIKFCFAMAGLSKTQDSSSKTTAVLPRIRFMSYIPHEDPAEFIDIEQTYCRENAVANVMKQMMEADLDYLMYMADKKDN